MDREGSWGCPWGASKWTKMDQNSHHSMTEQMCFEFVPSNYHDPFLGEMDTWKGIGVRTSHGGVVGSPMRCTKIDQNEPKLIQMVSIAKVFQICPESLIWPISGLNGHLKGNWSQNQSWRGGGVTHEVHQNWPNWTKIDPNGQYSMAEQCFKFVLSHKYDPFLE